MERGLVSQESEEPWEVFGEVLGSTCGALTGCGRAAGSVLHELMHHAAQSRHFRTKQMICLNV